MDNNNNKIHIHANTFSDYTLEFIIEIYFWNHFNKQFCNTSHERQMKNGSSRFTEEQTRQTVFLQK